MLQRFDPAPSHTRAAGNSLLPKACLPRTLAHNIVRFEFSHLPGVLKRRGVRLATDALLDHSRSPLDAHHLLEGVHHVDQVALRGHHGVDVLVGCGRLVDDVLVLVALDAFGRSAVIRKREPTLRLGSSCGLRRASSFRSSPGCLCLAPFPKWRSCCT
jgi:hypothetical protein